MDVCVAVHDKTNVGSEAACGARVASIGVLETVSLPVST